MKLAASALLAVVMLSSCVNAKGPGWSFTAVGTDADDLDMSATGLKAQKLRNSPALKHIKDGVTDIARIVGTNKLIQSGIDATKSLGTSTINAIK